MFAAICSTTVSVQKKMRNKDNKKKTVYKEDDGRTIYSLSFLDGLTPEEQEQRNEQRKRAPKVTRKERLAMIAAAFQVYAPMLLILIGCFCIVAFLMYLGLK